MRLRRVKANRTAAMLERKLLDGPNTRSSDTATLEAGKNREPSKVEGGLSTCVPEREIEICGSVSTRRERRYGSVALGHSDRIDLAFLRLRFEELKRVGGSPVRQSESIAHVKTALRQNGVQRFYVGARR